jgi:hypothetical protein
MNFKEYLEERLSDVKKKPGEMHKKLGVPLDQKIIDVYDDPKKLASDLLSANKGNRKKTSGMLAWAANIDSRKNVLDAALSKLKEVGKE